MIDIAEAVLKAKIYGKEYPYRKPRLGQVESMQKEMEGASSAASIGLMKKLVIECGFPEAMVNDLAMDDFIQLFEGLTEVKKK